MRRLSDDERNLLSQVVLANHGCDLSTLLAQLDAGEKLSADDANRLRTAIGLELAGTGFTGDEINPRGQRLEDLIDTVGHLSHMWEQTIAAVGTDDRIVLGMHPSDDLGEGNLFRVRTDGSETWRLQPPDGEHDFWTEARIDANVLVAHSLSGYVVRIDIESGRELARERPR